MNKCLPAGQAGSPAEANLIRQSWVCMKQYFMTQPCFVALHRAKQGQEPTGYCISLALVIQYPHFICRKGLLLATARARLNLIEGTWDAI